MGLLSRLGAVFRPETRAGGGYTDAALEAALNAAAGGLTAQAERTAAVEFGVGLLSRAFAAAIVEPDILARTALTPTIREGMIRRLLLTGNAVFAIDVTALGNVRLLPAFTHDVRGGLDESRWAYRLTLPTPSRAETRRTMSRGVVHIRIGADPNTPWQGCSPLLNAGLTSQMLARLEHRTGQEANARAGYVLPLPDGLDDETVDGLKADLNTLAGNIALVETTSAGMGQGRAAAHKLTGAYSAWARSSRRATSTCGGKLALTCAPQWGFRRPCTLGLTAQPCGKRTARLLVATIQPMAALITAELEAKLDTPVSFNFRRLAAADVAARARAFGTLVQSYVQAGVQELDFARLERLAGLNE